MNKFKKAAIATSVITLLGVAGSASAGNFVNLGCAASPGGTAGSTVYSVDAYDDDGVAITISGTVKPGASCARALNTLQSGGAYTLVAANNQTIATAGYSLQNFTLAATAGDFTGPDMQISTSSNIALIGCAAAPAGTAGGTVYSVDAQNSSGTNTSSLTALIGQPCSTGLATAAALGSGGSVNGLNNVTIANSGYSLNQWIVQ